MTLERDEGRPRRGGLNLVDEGRVVATGEIGSPRMLETGAKRCDAVN